MTSTRRSSFQTIKDDILDKIKTGFWQPGETIPGEEMLASQYGCSRMTVNRAIRELAEEGIVERRKKAGTKVCQQLDRSAKIQVQIVRAEVEGKGAQYRYMLLERTQMKPPEGVRAKMSLKEGDSVLYVRCLHFADERPYQYEERWINLTRVPAAREEMFEEFSPNEWLVKKEPFSDAEHIFSAQLCDAQTAELLDIQQGSPLFVIERRTWQDSDTITAVKMSYPGDTYRLISRG